MSNKKKPKKLRSPNVPTGSVARPLTTAAAGAATPARPELKPLASPGRQARGAVAMAAGPVQANFDYTYVKKDLSRIGVLAASFIVILVVLSFFIH
jgi:hypothetical protein